MFRFRSAFRKCFPKPTSQPPYFSSAAVINRRIASGLDGLGSGWRAIQVSRAASAGGRRRTPTSWPLPVVTGRPRFFALTPIGAMDPGLTRKRPGRKYPANPPGLTIPANRHISDGYRTSCHIPPLVPRRQHRRDPGEPPLAAVPALAAPSSPLIRSMPVSSATARLTRLRAPPATARTT